MSASAVRAKITVRLLKHALAEASVASPDMVPSGCGCSETTFQSSSFSRFAHDVREVVTAIHRPPTLSKTSSLAGYLPPVDAVATQALSLHTDRRCHVSENFAVALPFASISGPIFAAKVPVKGPVLGGGAAAVGVAVGVLVGLWCCETITAAKIPPPISTTIATTAGITTRGRRQSGRFGAGMGCGGGGCHRGGPGGGGNTGAAPAAASRVSWPWTPPTVGWTGRIGGCTGTIRPGGANGHVVASRAARANLTVVAYLS